MIKNVIFDIGQVLIRFEWKEYLRKLFPEGTAETVYKATFENSAWKDMDTGTVSIESVVKKFIESAPEYKGYITTAVERMGECAEKLPYSIPLIKAIKAKGINVYYLSNYSRYLKSANEDVLDFIGSMDGGLFSFEVNCTKPDERIYQLLCQKYGILPEESVFVDDRPENVNAASRIGFKTVLFKGEVSIPEVLDAACCMFD